MKICSGYKNKSLKESIKLHDEICYEVDLCPLCEKEKEIDRLQREIEALIKEMQRREDYIEMCLL